MYNTGMDIVIDTSAIVAVIANEPERPAIVRLTMGANVVAPASVHWGVGNAFSAMFKRNRISLAQSIEAINNYKQMKLRFVDIDLNEALEISHRLGLYAYDAYVLACAFKLRSPLLTLDTRLASVTPAAGIRALGVGI